MRWRLLALAAATVVTAPASAVVAVRPVGEPRTPAHHSVVLAGDEHDVVPSGLGADFPQEASATPLAPAARAAVGTDRIGAVAALASTARIVTTLGASDIPEVALRAYVRAQDTLAVSDPACGLSWSLLAAIGRVESNHGRFGGAQLRDDGYGTSPIRGVPLDGRPGVVSIPESDGGTLDGDAVHDRAVGPMQFIPSTWRAVHGDGNGDGRDDPDNMYDASLGAAVYLCAGSADLRGQRAAAVMRYNHSQTYVDVVLALAGAYEAGRRAELPQPGPALKPPPTPTVPPPLPASIGGLPEMGEPGAGDPSAGRPAASPTETASPTTTCTLPQATSTTTTASTTPEATSSPTTTCSAPAATPSPTTTCTTPEASQSPTTASTTPAATSTTTSTTTTTAPPVTASTAPAATASPAPAASVRTRQGAQIELWITKSAGCGLATALSYLLPDGSRAGGAITGGAPQPVRGAPRSTWMGDVSEPQRELSVFTVDSPAVRLRFFLGHVPQEATMVNMTLSDGRALHADVQPGGYYLVPLDDPGDLDTPATDRPSPSEGTATNADGVVVATFNVRP